jgi:hypothetical protein
MNVAFSFVNLNYILGSRRIKSLSKIIVSWVVNSGENHGGRGIGGWYSFLILTSNRKTN